MSTSNISDAALRYMESNTIDYIQTKRFMESSNLREYFKFGMLHEDIERDFSVPIGNRTKSSTGRAIFIKSPKPLYQFPAKLKLYDNNESTTQVEPSVQTLYQRGMARRRSIFVYVNGLKIPDKEVYLYASPAGSDIFIPQEYFSDVEPNELVCVVKDFSDRSYNNYYNDHQGGTSIRNIPTTLSNINKKRLNIWVNGLYLHSTQYDLTSGSNTFNITLNSGVVDADMYSIEIMFDKHQFDKYQNNYLGNNGKLFLFAPKRSDVLIETALFINMCDVYINGLRVSPSHLQQKTYRHIMYNGDISFDKTPLTEIVVSDNQLDVKAFASYMNDFMEYEKWSDELGIVKSLNDEEVIGEHIISPPFISSDTLQFPPANMYNFDNNMTFELSNEQRAELMIRENSHYIKNLLSYYSIEEEEYSIKRTGIVKPNEMVTIHLDMDSSDDYSINTRHLELYVNDNKIPDADLVYHEQWGTDNVKIPISKFSTGSNKTDKVRLYKNKVDNTLIPFVKFSLGNTVIGGGEVDITSLVGYNGDLGSFKLPELRIFRQITNQETNTFNLFLDLTGASVYYDIIENSPSNYTLRSEVDSITGKDKLFLTVPSGTALKNNDIIMVINPKFHGSTTFNIPRTGDYNSQFRVILNQIDEGEVIPFITNDYLLKVYVNGQLLVPDLDYMYTSPDKYNRLTSSQIIFRRSLTMTDVIEVVCTGIKNKCFANYDIIPISNQYGFIFFDKLTIPFNLDYMDLYLNGQKLTDEDIVVYTDRLIRVRKTLPYQNIVLYTRLTRDLDDFEPYIQAYNQTSCSFDEYIRQFCKDVIFDVSEKPSSTTLIDEIFSEVFDGDRTPNDIISEEELTLTERFDTFLDRITRDYNRNINLIDKVFDANENKLVDAPEYDILIPDRIRETHLIDFNANDDESISEDFTFDQNIHYRTDAQIIKLVKEIFIQDKISLNSNDNLGAYEEPIFRHYLYVSDVNEFDSNVELTEDIIINSNEGIEE